MRVILSDRLVIKSFIDTDSFNDTVAKDWLVNRQMGFIADKKGNKFHFEDLGYRGVADTLDDLIRFLDRFSSSNCTNCEDCFGCKDCRDCMYCIECVESNNCITSTRLNNCTDCSMCDDCVDCLNCMGCHYCKDCKGCWNCEHCENLVNMGEETNLL